MQQGSGALDADQTPPRPPVNTNVTKAPARWDGQSLARRTACFTPGGVPRNDGERLPVVRRKPRAIGALDTRLSPVNTNTAKAPAARYDRQ